MVNAPSVSPSEGSSDLSFKTEFAVELHCEACVAYVKGLLSEQPGVESYTIDLKEQRVFVEGKLPPSRVARALRQDGRQVVVRGTGTATGENDGAAVCIFESYTPPSTSSSPQALHAVARLVQVANTTLLDLTVKHSPSSEEAIKHGLGVYVASSGDLSAGASSTGKILKELGTLELRKKDGYGDLFAEFKGLEIWSLIGRAMVIAPLTSPSSSTQAAQTALSLQLGPGILAGVIARSAGAWGNSAKTVCTCSGKTVFEEARDQKII